MIWEQGFTLDRLKLWYLMLEKPLAHFIFHTICRLVAAKINSSQKSNGMKKINDQKQVLSGSLTSGEYEYSAIYF